MMKDETKEEELLEVLVEYHKTVPISEDGKLDPKLCFGECVFVFTFTTSI